MEIINMACKKLRGLLVSEHEVLVLSPTAIWRLSAFRNWRCTKRTVTDGTRREFRSAGIYAFPLRSSQCCVACFDGNPVRMDLEKGTSETTVEDLLEQIHPDAGYASAACTSRMRAEPRELRRPALPMFLPSWWSPRPFLAQQNLAARARDSRCRLK
jgi:hypothetical protein